MKQTTPQAPDKASMQTALPVCWSYLSPEKQEETAHLFEKAEPAELPDVIRRNTGEFGLPGFLPELARLEHTYHAVRQATEQINTTVSQLTINPSLNLIRLSRQGLANALLNAAPDMKPEDRPGEEYVIIWKEPGTNETRIQAASNVQLLALKMVAEERDAVSMAATEEKPASFFEEVISQAVDQGILQKPASLLKRAVPAFYPGNELDELHTTAEIFTLQWHITQACDLRCRHCYDRSSRDQLGLDRALQVLDEMEIFCRQRHVRGQISFSGGNPFLHPNFFELYEAAAQRGFIVAILGNPVSRQQLERLSAIEHPSFYQLSLEGLAEHNDYIRGEGYFQRVLEFLALLKEFDIFSMVMLTLTSANRDQVLPLAEILRDKVDLFTFNRLSTVGEGAALAMADKGSFQEFLEGYMTAAEHNPIIGMKESLLNVIRRQWKMDLFGGCAGFGCGAAFNFLSLLPDGEVHACRKFPSPLGRLSEHSLAEVYDSEIARQYRAGSRACDTCTIRPVCGGCLAVSHSLGLNIFKERDPYCFVDEQGL